MKFLFENWRGFLNEEEVDLKAIPIIEDPSAEELEHKISWDSVQETYDIEETLDALPVFEDWRNWPPSRWAPDGPDDWPSMILARREKLWRDHWKNHAQTKDHLIQFEDQNKINKEMSWGMAALQDYDKTYKPTERIDYGETAGYEYAPREGDIQTNILHKISQKVPIGFFAEDPKSFLTYITNIMWANRDPKNRLIKVFHQYEKDPHGDVRQIDPNTTKGVAESIEWVNIKNNLLNNEQFKKLYDTLNYKLEAHYPQSSLKVFKSPDDVMGEPL